jgi:hypothetical protein
MRTRRTGLLGLGCWDPCDYVSKGKVVENDEPQTCSTHTNHDTFCSLFLPRFVPCSHFLFPQHILRSLRWLRQNKEEGKPWMCQLSASLTQAKGQVQDVLFHPFIWFVCVLMRLNSCKACCDETGSRLGFTQASNKQIRLIGRHQSGFKGAVSSGAGPVALVA